MVKCSECNEVMKLEDVCDNKNYYECPACGNTQTVEVDEEE